LNRKKNILICPLEWGLGHAARMIPVASMLRDLNNNVFIGAGEEHLALFRAEVKGMTLINFPGFKPGYSRFFPQYLIMLLKSPLLLYHIISEHYKIKKIIAEYNIDIIISDNRFGLWNKKIFSVYVTHILCIPLPKLFRVLEMTGVMLHRAIIKKYSLCFIPDLPGELNISGRLSHGLKLPDNARFIGILSRFTASNAGPGEFKFPHNTVILSGPEPQRGILKKMLIDLLSAKEPPTVILEGKPHKEETTQKGSIICYSHLPTAHMSDMIRNSAAVISRSGYTTIMDLISLNCSALLIPTPGQTEQEYLAQLHAEKGWFSMVSQSKIKEGLHLRPTESKWPREIIEMSRVLLEKEIRELLEK
jgi:hypothetical protein